MLKLYEREISGNSYRVRLMLALLNLPYERIPTYPSKTDGKLPAGFLDLSPRGQVPVLTVDGTPLWDSHAALLYLGLRYGSNTWLPGDPLRMAVVTQWMALSLNECTYGLARSRAIRSGRRAGDLQATQEMGSVALKVCEGRLADNDWLAEKTPTIADIACYPYVALAPEAGLTLDGYPGIQRWIQRIQSLPGYVDLPVDRPAG